MTTERTLRLYTPVTWDATPQHVTTFDDATGWSRSKRRDGGDWMGEFTLEGDPVRLGQYFYEFLGYDFKEYGGGAGVTWRGMVYEMDYTVRGVTRRRTFDLMYNAVNATYTYGTADTLGTTDYALGTASIARYGRREERLLMDGISLEAVEAYRDSYLKEHQYPWPRVVGWDRKQEKDPDVARLDVTVCGYAFTGNWQFVGTATATRQQDEVSDYITLIAQNDCEFYLKGAIERNTVQVWKFQNIPQRAYDEIQRMTGVGGTATSLGGSAITPWRFYVDSDRRAYYRPVDTTAQYYLKRGKLYSTPGGHMEVNPWELKPGVIRDLDYPARQMESGAWFADGRDFYAAEVEYGDNFDRPVLKTDYFEESDVVAERLRFEKVIEQEKKRKKRKT